jgi:antitoxin ParD1/3/4
MEMRLARPRDVEECNMDIQIPAEQKAFLDDLVTAGKFSSIDEAVSEGIRLLVARDRLKQQVEIGIDQADRGDLVDHDTVFAQLRAMAAP